MSRVAPYDNRDSGTVWSDVQPHDVFNDELRDIMPAFWVYSSSGVQYERQIDQPATIYDYNVSVNKFSYLL